MQPRRTAGERWTRRRVARRSCTRAGTQVRATIGDVYLGTDPKNYDAHILAVTLKYKFD